MSQVMEGVDARGYLVGWLHGVTDMYVKDINATPDEVLFKSHGGCTRPGNEIAADTLGLIRWTTDALNGNSREMDMGAEMAEAASKLTSKAAIVEAMQTSSAALGEAIKNASDETLNKMVTPPWKMDAPLFILATIAVNHIWYHDGQINYIQALNGDAEVHWM